MSEYTLEIKQIVDYPRCRIYRQFVQALIADRSIRVSGDSGLFYFQRRSWICLTRYFMKFTPLFAAEVQMMTPPRHQPRRSGRIVIEDLAFSELVSDRAFRLILGALLLCRYGEVVLNLERKTEEIT